LPGGDSGREQAGELTEARGVRGLDLGGDGGLVGGERGGLHEHPAGLRVADDVVGLGEPADGRVNPGDQAAVPFLVRRDEQRFLAGEVQVRGPLDTPAASAMSAIMVVW
jgi:hypothetical protein